MDIFRDVISLIGDRREPLADTKCLPAVQRKQARSALVLLIFIRQNIMALGSNESDNPVHIIELLFLS